MSLHLSLTLNKTLNSITEKERHPDGIELIDQISEYRTTSHNHDGTSQEGKVPPGSAKRLFEAIIQV
jgi:hypothetical protein